MKSFAILFKENLRPWTLAYSDFNCDRRIILAKVLHGRRGIFNFSLHFMNCVGKHVL